MIGALYDDCNINHKVNRKADRTRERSRARCRENPGLDNAIAQANPDESLLIVSSIPHNRIQEIVMKESISIKESTGEI